MTPGPWAAGLLRHVRGGAAETSEPVEALRIEPALVTARVGGRAVTLSAPPIPPGIWAAVAGSVTPKRQSFELAQLLEHTWVEPLVPAEVVRVGADADADAVLRALAAEVDRDPAALLRWRGYDAESATGDEAWRGGELPPLPPPARRPPESVPKRFGASGIATPDGDLVEVLVRAYRAFQARG